jgi:hypothetical protein
MAMLLGPVAAMADDEVATSVAVDPAPIAEAMDGSKAGSGAAAMEPAEAIDEEPGTAAHQAWVASIWSSP